MRKSGRNPGDLRESRRLIDCHVAGQQDAKYAALPQFAFDFYRAAMQVYNPFRDCKAKTRAAALRASRSIDAVKALKNMAQFLRRDSDAGVAHLHHCLIVAEGG